MQISFYVFPKGEDCPTYYGQIEMKAFDAEKCWHICQWENWTDEKPKELLIADKIIADFHPLCNFGHGICFRNPETGENWLALSQGWLVGTSTEITDYVRAHKDEIFWEKPMNKFQVGDKFCSTDIFTSGQMYYEIVSRTETEITCDCTDVELDGTHNRQETFEVLTDDKGEYIILWEYLDHKGIMYAENEENNER